MPKERYDFQQWRESHENAPVQTDDQAKAAALVDGRKHEGEENRTHLVINWLLNKAYVRGDQWVTADTEPLTSDARLRRQRAPSWARQITANTLFNDLRVMVAKITARQLQPTVLPLTSDESDRAKARASEGLLRYFIASEEGQRKQVLLATELCETGIGWLRIGWDPNRGDYLPPPEGVDELDIKVDQFEKEGAMDIRVCSPLDILIDPGPTRSEDARWIIHKHVLHIDEIYELFGVRVNAERGLSNNHILDDQTDISPEHHNAQNMAVVSEYWQLPDKDWPTGVYVVEAGGLCLKLEEGVDEFPFVKFEFFPDPNSQYPITPIDFGRIMQRELNLNISAMVQGRDLSIYGKWLNPIGNGVGNITRAPGEIIDYDPSVGPPVYQRQDPFSQQVFSLTALIADLKQKCIGIDDATLGDAGSQQSGRSIAFQAEEDLAKLGPTMTCWKASWKKAFLMMLKTWRKYAKRPIRYQVLGQNAASDMTEIDRADIEYYDIDVGLENSLPQNKQARRELVLMLMQAGVVDQNEARRLMEFGDVEDAFGSQNVDRQRARAENEMLLYQDVPVEMHENHVIHMEVLLQYMKNEAWYRLDDTTKLRYRNHLQAHMAMMQGGSVPTGGPEGAGQGPQVAGAVQAVNPPPQSEAPESGLAEALGPQEQQAVRAIRGEI